MTNLISSEAYLGLLQDLEETILVWQKKHKEKLRDKRFNARFFLAEQMGYKDVKILYRMLDSNNTSSCKVGVEDIEKICRITGDLTPLQNFVDALEEEIR